MPEMKTLQGYEIVDAKARKDIEALKNAGHATEEYVDNAIAAIPEVDLTPYATETYVDNAIDNIPEVDLSKHALKSELPTKVSQLENDSKFITREEVPETDLSEYAKKSELPSVPTKVSAFTNDAGYLTAHQDISGKADKNHTHPEYLTQHQPLDEYAKKSEIPDVSDFITSIPSEYITESELNAKGYLTEHQSLAGYATEKYVDDAIAEGAKIVFIDWSYTKETIEAILKAGNWPVFKDTVNGYTLPLVRIFTGVSYYFGGIYDKTVYSIRYHHTGGWDTIISGAALVEKDVDIKANAFGDPVDVLTQIKISGRIYSIPGTGSAWKRTNGGQWTEDLSSAKEIYVCLKNIYNEAYYSSCTVFPEETLDQHFSEKFATNAFNTDGTPVCWYYEGTNFQLDGNGDGTYEIAYVAYKV